MRGERREPRGAGELLPRAALEVRADEQRDARALLQLLA